MGVERRRLSPVYAMTSSACTVDRRTRHLHLDAAPRELVRALTADLDRGGGRDRQLDLAAEALEPLAELVLARRRVAFRDLPLRIPGRGSRR